MQHERSAEEGRVGGVIGEAGSDNPILVFTNRW